MILLSVTALGEMSNYKGPNTCHISGNGATLHTDRTSVVSSEQGFGNEVESCSSLKIYILKEGTHILLRRDIAAKVEDKVS